MAEIEPGKAALLILDAIVQMSDHAQKMGGATSISGVAALHKMQASIQKNRPRIIAIAKLMSAEAQPGQTP